MLLETFGDDSLTDHTPQLVDLIQSSTREYCQHMAFGSGYIFILLMSDIQEASCAVQLQRYHQMFRKCFEQPVLPYGQAQTQRAAKTKLYAMRVSLD